MTPSRQTFAYKYLAGVECEKPIFVHSFSGVNNLFRRGLANILVWKRGSIQLSGLFNFPVYFGASERNFNN